MRTQLLEFTRKLVAAVRASPQLDIATLLARYDIAQALVVALERAEEAAQEAVDTAWAVPGASEYREALRADVARAYADARAEIPGIITAAAVGGARAVHEAMVDYASRLILRNRLTITTAGVASASAKVVAEAQLRASAGEDVSLEWVASMEGKDPRSCAWCKWLHGKQVDPGHEFPHPAAIGKHKPPKIYLGKLFGPPLHHRCRCKLAIVTGSSGPVPAAGLGEEAIPEDFLSSEQIAAMDESAYGKLHHFLSSALHELGQMIRKLMSVGH